MMKGLIIKEPWIDLILDGKKVWEIRGSKTNVRGKIQLIKSGTGLIIGEVELINCIPLKPLDLIITKDKHLIDGDLVEEFCMKYDNPYAWVLINPKRYDNPIPYKHPKGAIIWVNLDGN